MSYQMGQKEKNCKQLKYNSSLFEVSTVLRTRIVDAMSKFSYCTFFSYSKNVYRKRKRIFENEKDKTKMY